MYPILFMLSGILNGGCISLNSNMYDMLFALETHALSCAARTVPAMRDVP